MTDSTGPFAIELLAKTHQRGRFDCGVEALNRFIHAQARQDMDRGVAVVCVAVPADAPAQVAGYYSLASTAVRLEDLPDATRRKLPRYPLVPATLLGRLAVGRQFRGQRLGEYLLVDALRRARQASQSVASVAVIVDAKDDSAAAFYARYGFTVFPDRPHRLFIAMKTIEQLG